MTLKQTTTNKKTCVSLTSFFKEVWNVNSGHASWRLLAKQYLHHPTSNNRRKLIVATTILALYAKTLHNQCCSVNFNTDSHPIGVDKRCTASISHNINNFVGKLRQSNWTIKGFGGARHSSHIMVGNITWKWCNDEGKVHKHIIPNSYYVPHGKAWLLSPQL